MIIRDNGGKDYELIDAGLHAGICTRVVPLGVHDTDYGKKEKLVIIFELAEKMSDGRPFMLSKIYTASTNEKANLRKDLNTWRGVAMTDAEAAAFDTDVIVGKPAYINVVHSQRDGKTYANIGGILRLPKGIEPPVSTEQPTPEWITKMAAKGGINANTDGINQTPPADNEEPLPF